MPPPRFEWILPEPLPDIPTFDGFGPAVTTLLARRGFRTDADLRAFLQPGPEALHDPRLMADAEAALDRVEAALRGDEPIAIWGDYDADGMTAVAIWVRALRALGREPRRFVPSRVAEGYGLSVSGLERLRDEGVRLVVTVDCGVANVAEVAAAGRIGLDVIVTDHHLPTDRLPPAVAVVDPRRPDCPYPDADLTGAGLAFKLASALLDRRGVAAGGLAGLAAIGTVADVAPMVGESRAIVALGLAELASSPPPGLAALLRRAAEAGERPTARDLAFGVAPRLNAAGRLADADLAIALLLEDDAERAERLAGELEAIHVRRRELTAEAVAVARQLAAATPGSGPLFLRHDEWLPGLLGLVAARLCDDLARPVAVATLVGAELRGSLRAPADFHSARALEACAGWLTRHGGHAAAGGFSLGPGDAAGLAGAFAALPRPFPASTKLEVARPGRLVVDLVLTAPHLGWSLSDELGRLAPYGPGHTEPLLAVTGLRLGEARRVGGEQQHLSLRMRRGVEVVDAIQFDAPRDVDLPEPGTPLDLVGTLERDTFEGVPRLRLRVLDWAQADASPLRQRRHAVPLAMATA